MTTADISFSRTSVSIAQKAYSTIPSSPRISLVNSSLIIENVEFYSNVTSLSLEHSLVKVEEVGRQVVFENVLFQVDAGIFHSELNVALTLQN